MTARERDWMWGLSTGLVGGCVTPALFEGSWGLSFFFFVVMVGLIFVHSFTYPRLPHEGG